MDDKIEPEKTQAEGNTKRSPFGELRALTDDLRRMTDASEEATAQARDRRQEIERALRSRRFWVPEQ